MEMRTLEKILAPIRRSLRTMITRAVVKSVDDGTFAQTVQAIATADETMIVEHFQPYGLTAHPVAGSEAVLLTAGGDRSTAILIGVMKRSSRPTGLASGEVALYTGSTAQILLKTDGAVYVGSPDGTEPMVLGAALKAWLETHTHPTAMGPSGPPIQAATLDSVLSVKHKLDV